MLSKHTMTFYLKYASHSFRGQSVLADEFEAHVPPFYYRSYGAMAVAVSKMKWIA